MSMSSTSSGMKMQYGMVDQKQRELLATVLPVNLRHLDPVYHATVKLLCCQLLSKFAPDRVRADFTAVHKANSSNEVKFALEPVSLYADRSGFHLCTRPLQQVEVFGIVVGLKETVTGSWFQVDDGTAVVVCQFWNPNNLYNKKARIQPSEHARVLTAEQKKAENLGIIYDLWRPYVVLGDFVRVIGEIREYQGQHEITTASITVENDDPNLETLHKLETLQLYRDVYSQVCPAVEKQLKRISET